MSKRFGRNQRRRAREAIAHAEGEALRWQEANSMAEGLAAHLNRKVRRLEGEIDEAKDIAHRMSHLFPASEEFDQSDRKPPMRGEMFMVDVPARLLDLDQFLADASPIQKATYRRVPLALLLSRVMPEAIDHGIQVRVRFANNEVAYGITAAAWHTMSNRERTERIKHEIAPQLAKLLVETTDLRSYR